MVSAVQRATRAGKRPRCFRRVTSGAPGLTCRESPGFSDWHRAPLGGVTVARARASAAVARLSVRARSPQVVSWAHPGSTNAVCGWRDPAQESPDAPLGSAPLVVAQPARPPVYPPPRSGKARAAACRALSAGRQGCVVCIPSPEVWISNSVLLNLRLAPALTAFHTYPADTLVCLVWHWVFTFEIRDWIIFQKTFEGLNFYPFLF